MTNTLEQVQDPSEVEAQVALEATMLTEGILRYNQKAAKEHAQGQLTKAELKVLEKSIGAVAEEIERHLQDLLDDRKAAGGRGKLAGYVYPLSLVDPKVLAFAALNMCFVKVMKQESELRILLGIGRAVETEIWARQFQTTNPEVYHRVVKLACKRHSTREYRMTAVTHTANKENFDVPSWDESFCLSVGSALLNAVLKTTNFFELYDTSEGVNHTVKCVGFTKEAVELLATMNLDSAMTKPLFLPLLVPPKPWETIKSGCFHDPRLSRLVPMVRTFDKKHKALLKEADETGQLSPVKKALTNAGNVPLTINSTVLDVLKYVADNKVEGIEGLPAWSYYPLPSKVHPVKWRIMPSEEKKRWKKMRQELVIKNRSLECQWATLKRDISIATDFLGKTFYQGYSCDKRGRLYAISSFNHMRADHIRNLFQFANGKPLGNSGARWLAIHIASTADFKVDGVKVSKMSFNDREQWTLDNTEWIESIGSDPKGTVSEWRKADKPFAFLAACIAWVGYRTQGAAYVCHLPIPLDGSNSGVQHYCASLRSEEGVLVNLKHAPKPEDIYNHVAVSCATQAEQDVSKPQVAHLAKLWLDFGIGRSEVKRSVMTFAYSSDDYGFKQQLIEDLMEPLREKVLKIQGVQDLDDKREQAKEARILFDEDTQEVVHPFGTEDVQRAAAGYLAVLIYKKVKEVVSKAAEGMKFLQDCAGLLAHEGKPVNWVTPLGLPVQNMYEEYDQKRVELFLYDRKVKVHEAREWDRITKDGQGVLKKEQVTLRTDPTGKVIKTKMKSTVSPNFIHSMDACHLQTTVNYAVDAGITDLLLIHDSFSTHACDTSRFQMIIKQAFVDMYENNDVFAQFHQRVLEDISEANRDKVPTPPTKGTLDLQEVLESDYAFS